MKSGSQLGPYASVEDARYWANSGATLARYQIAFDPEESSSWTFNQWRNNISSSLLNLRSWISESPLKVVIDLHIPWRERNVVFWSEIALLFKGEENIFAFGLLNEPVAKQEKIWDWMEGQTQLIKAYDPNRKVIATPRASSPSEFKNLKPIDEVKLYEAHMYWPLKITHQGIDGSPTGFNYPTAKVNKEALKRYLKPVRDFQVKYKKKIFLGEFGISNYAPEDSRLNYIRDVISICKKWGWHWCIHSFPGSPYWDMEQPEELAEIVYDGWKNT